MPTRHRLVFLRFCLNWCPISDHARTMPPDNRYKRPSNDAWEATAGSPSLTRHALALMCRPSKAAWVSGLPDSCSSTETICNNFWDSYTRRRRGHRRHAVPGHDSPRESLASRRAGPQPTFLPNLCDAHTLDTLMAQATGRPNYPSSFTRSQALKPGSLEPLPFSTGGP